MAAMGECLWVGVSSRGRWEMVVDGRGRDRRWLFKELGRRTLECKEKLLGLGDLKLGYARGGDRPAYKGDEKAKLEAEDLKWASALFLWILKDIMIKEGNELVSGVSELKLMVASRLVPGTQAPNCHDAEDGVLPGFWSIYGSVFGILVIP